MRIYRELYLPTRFFGVFLGVVFIFMLSFPLSILFPLAQFLCIVFIVIFITDVTLLFSHKIKITAIRKTDTVLSLGSRNEISIITTSNAPISLKIKLTDELPEQLQERRHHFLFTMNPESTEETKYYIRPDSRGVYRFGRIHHFIQSKIGMAERRISIPADMEIDVYPSIIEMKQFELRSLPKVMRQYGVKKIRRIGHSYEFEQIKNYAEGDDFRNINWKATGRRSLLMVNQYEDEKSQPVYNIIDNSRSMLMPFNRLSLLDYSVNASLVISNVVLAKHDKAGLMTFSNKSGSVVKAEKNRGQLNRILLQLYNITENKLEANYDLLYTNLRSIITHRSLLFLYTNFESRYAMQRALPVITQLSRLHLLVLIMFENTEIYKLLDKEAEKLDDIYLHAVAHRFMDEKIQIAQELQLAGIQTIITRPEDLTINTLNKYLELKARGMI